MQSTHRSRKNNSRSRRIAGIFTIIVVAGVTFSCGTPHPYTTAVSPAAPPNFTEAVALYYEGDFQKSIEVLKDLMAVDMQDVRPRWQIIREYQEAGEYGPAAAVLRQLIAANPDDARTQEALFVNLLLAGDLAAARAMLPLPVQTAHSLFYEGLLFMETGDAGRAIPLFRKCLSMQEYQPMAWYFLGKLLYGTGDYKTAEKCFNRVLSQNPGLTIALEPLADSMLAQGNFRAAYPMLLRARNILPDNTGIAEKITELERQHPELLRKREETRARVQKDTVPPLVKTFPGTTAGSPIIRVGLAENLQSITIKTGGQFTIRRTGGDSVTIYQGPGSELLLVRSTTEGVALSLPGDPPFLTSATPVTLKYDKPQDTTVVFSLVNDRGSFYATTTDPAYRGTIEFRPSGKGVSVINSLPLDEYLYSVLPSEMPGLWPMAALEAQAVAARSYTLASLGTFASKGYDVQGSVVSAAYGGVGSEYPNTTEAVNATAGQILIYNGKPLKAFYSANSGGYSENSTVVWGEPAGMAAVPDILTPPRENYLPLAELITWLRSDPKTYSSVSPYYSRAAYRWVKWVSADEISRRVGRSEDIGTVLSVITRGRGISGRVEKVEVTGTKGSVILRGDRIRGALGLLRSTLFTVRPRIGRGGVPEYFIFTGGGWGHGVGMDQSGSAGMASAGYTYKEILAHYYPLAVLGTDRTSPASNR